MRTALAGFGLSLLAVVSHAQEPPHHGVWIGAGVGAGWAGATCNDCVSAGRLSGWSGYLRAGTTVAPRTRLAGELDGWVRTPDGAERIEGGANERVVMLGIAVLGYPIHDQGLFLKLGLGVSQYRSRVGTSVLKATGLAPHAGLGYDIGVAHELYLTPYVQYLRSIAGSHVNIDGEETSFSFHPNLIQAGLGVRWR